MIDLVILLAMGVISVTLIDAQQYGWAVAVVAIAAAVYVATEYLNRD